MQPPAKHPYIAGLLLTAVFFAALSVTAQLGSTGSIIGKVALPNGSTINVATMVRLESSRGVRANSFTDNQGQFRFGGLTPGLYTVVVESDDKQFEVTSLTVEVFRNAPSLVTVVLKEKKGAGETKRLGDSVSIAELDPDIPSGARKEFERGVDHAKQGRPEQAITHFRKAIDQYPRFLMARNDLGAQLLAVGRLDEAADELRRAIDIDSKAFNPHLNLGIVLVQQHEFMEARQELAKALSLKGNSASARLYLGIALVGLGEFDAAERELKAAFDLGGATHALALYHLGQLYFGRGEREAALRMFETYLSLVPTASNASEVRQLIALLK